MKEDEDNDYEKYFDADSGRLDIQRVTEEVTNLSKRSKGLLTKLAEKDKSLRSLQHDINKIEETAANGINSKTAAKLEGIVTKTRELEEEIETLQESFSQSMGWANYGGLFRPSKRVKEFFDARHFDEDDDFFDRTLGSTAEKPKAPEEKKEKEKASLEKKLEKLEEDRHELENRLKELANVKEPIVPEEEEDQIN
eukprot:Trichotokara_eunicae@DN5773_c0_g1_i1.p1